MKKLFLSILAVSALALGAYAFEPVWKASNTATADTTQPLCPGNSYVVNTATITVGQRGLLHGVCVNDVPTMSGTVTLYNSIATAVSPVAVIRSTAAYTSGCQIFDVAMSSGIVYTNSTAANVTFLYQCY